MPRKIDYIVPQSFDGAKIYSLLRGFCGFSSRLVRTVRHTQGGIKLNGEDARTIDRIKAGDTVSVFIEDAGNMPEPLEAELDIIFEDDDILVINKSPFMAMHPTHNHQGDTLANAVAAYYAKKGTNLTFRAVGRLDKGTSGLVVIALNSLAACKLSGKIKKEYVALVKGEMPDEGTVDTPIYRPDPMKTLRACSNELGVETAVTHWKTKKRFETASLIELNLETGRTHQIRVHMSSIGHELAGDTLYGEFMSETGHQLLHCAKCSFLHPVSGESVIFEAELPPDFKYVLSGLVEID